MTVKLGLLFRPETFLSFLSISIQVTIQPSMKMAKMNREFGKNPRERTVSEKDLFQE